MSDYSRRVKKLQIAPEIIVDLLKKGIHSSYEVVKDALPDDAKIISAHWDRYVAIELIIASKTYPKVKLGRLIPELSSPTLRIL